MDKHEIAAVLHFMKLARHGKHPGSSSGEKSAFKLARLAENISGLMQDLDGGNQDAFLNLLRGLAWPDGREILLKTVRGI